MKWRLTSLVGAALLAACLTTQAHATTINWGTITPTAIEPVTNSLPPSGTLPSSGAFTDIYRFTLSAGADLSAAVLDVNFNTLFNLKSFHVDLVNCGGLGASCTSGDPVLDTSGTVTTNFPVTVTLATNGLNTVTQYAVRIAGIVAGSLGGAYSGNVTLSAVPVPPAVWLLLSALIGLAVFVRRQGAAPATA
jgi:hypothetical protein